MDVDPPLDDKKPLSSLEDEEESQPDPDEALRLDAGSGKIWLVKVLVTSLFHHITAHDLIYLLFCANRFPSSSWSAGLPLMLMVFTSQRCESGTSVTRSQESNACRYYSRLIALEVRWTDTCLT